MEVDSSSSPPRFQIDQRVYARDYQLEQKSAEAKSVKKKAQKRCYYKAVVRKLKWASNVGVNTANNEMATDEPYQWAYLVHYDGWNSRWDRWLSEDSLLAADTKVDDDESIQIVQKRKGPTGNNNNETGSNGNKRRKVASSSGANYSSANVLQPVDDRSLAFRDVCSLPLTLRIVLVDEYERLHRPDYGSSARMLHQLPTPKVTVKQVLDHFKKRNVQDQPATVDFCRDLLELFELAVQKTLLYQCEHDQFQYLMQNAMQEKDEKTRKWAEILGPEYLLRLFVRLPFLLPPVAGNNNSADTTETASPLMNPTVCGKLLADLVVLMQRNCSTLFATPSQYIRASEFASNNGSTR